MRRELTNGGSDRRTFLQTLAAAGVIGATQPIGSALAQEGADAYHEQLQTALQDGQGLPAGEFVYGTTEGAAIEAFSLTGAGSGSETQFSVDSGDVPITTADRIAVNEEPTNNYDYTYQGFVTDRSFSAGDVLLGVAYVRSDTDDAQTQAGFKYRYRDPVGNTSYSGSFVQESATIQPSGEWTRYFFPIEVGEKPDGSAYEPYLEFWTGFAEQTIEFGGVALLDYSDTDVAVGDLPVGAPGNRNPLLDYEGREEGAQWRQDARARIEEVRKADAEITVVDGDGNPVPDATVDVEMAEHAFDFGAAVSVPNILGEDDADEQYRQVFRENFNKAVVENGLKYPAFHGPWGDSKADAIQALKWLNDRDVPVRGHYLVWEEYTNDGGGGMAIENPDTYTDAELQQLVLDRLTSHATDVGDRVTEWDMHNHPIWQPNIRQGRLGWAEVLEWWNAADGATDADLYTNEMGNVAGDFFRSQHLDFVQRLIDDGAPIDGIGFMGHSQFPNGNVTPPKEVLSTYDAFGETGLPILITEFDVQIAESRPTQQVDWQADFVRDFLIATFSHEAVEGIMSWGFWAEDHWRPTGAYYDADWNLRPHGERYMDLVFEEWWTEERGQADVDGVYALRGFEGEYEITATDGRRAGATTATIDDDNGAITVQITPKSIGDVDIDVADNTLWGDQTVEMDVALADADGDELPAPGAAVTFESDAPDAVAVDGNGVVSVAGTGAATVTATVSAYGDTAVGSARFAAYDEPAIIDPAEDFSLAASSQGLEVTRYQERHGDGARFRTVDPATAGSVTYRLEEGVAAFRAVTYVNYQEFDGSDDVYEGLTFEVSADGDSWKTVAAEPETVVAAGDANGYFAKRRYLVTSGVPDDATHLRVTLSASQANWAANVGSIDVWANTASLGGADATGPAIVVDGVQAGDTYETPHPADVTIVDDQTTVTERTVTLNGESWSGGQLTARGRNVLSASATSEGGVRTAVDLAFAVENTDGDLLARLQPNETQATVGDRLTFQVEDTTGNEHWIDSLEWSFDDGTTGSGWWQDHRFAEPGAYTVSLTATDDEGNTTTDAVVVWITDLQSNLAVAEPSTTTVPVDERVEFRVTDTTDDGRWIDSLEWTFGDGASAEGWWAAHRYGDAGTYTVTLTATDNLGYSTEDEVEITVG